MDTRIDPFAMKFESPAEFGRLLGAAGQVRPAFFDEVKRYWVMLRHRDIVAALRDYETFSASFYEPGPVGGTFISKDGERHRCERRAFARAFHPLALKESEAEFVVPAAQAVVDRLAGRRTCDLISDFCYPLTIGVLAPLLSVSTDFIYSCLDLVPSIMRWTIWSTDPEAVAAGRRARAQIMEKLTPLVEEQRRRPGRNLIGQMIEAQRDDGGSEDMDMILQIASGLVLGGYETTTWMIAGALSALLLHPEVLDRVRVDRSLLAPAIEESLRWGNSAIGVPRRVLRDVRLGEGEAAVTIPAGSDVLLCTVGAHYDPEVYPQPEVFDIDRRVEPLLFGGGPHHCIGAPLARTEARVGISMLLDRCPSLRLDPARWPQFRFGIRGTALHGADALNVLWGMGCSIAGSAAPIVRSGCQ